MRRVIPRTQMDQARGISPLASEAVAGRTRARTAQHTAIRVITPRQRRCLAAPDPEAEARGADRPGRLGEKASDRARQGRAGVG